MIQPQTEWQNGKHEPARVRQRSTDVLLNLRETGFFEAADRSSPRTTSYSDCARELCLTELRSVKLVKQKRFFFAIVEDSPLSTVERFFICFIFNYLHFLIVTNFVTELHKSAQLLKKLSHWLQKMSHENRKNAHAITHIVWIKNKETIDGRAKND